MRDNSMYGFIEITRQVTKERVCLNINHISDIIEDSDSKTAKIFMSSNSEVYYLTTESYQEVMDKIKEYNMIVSRCYLDSDGRLIPIKRS